MGLGINSPAIADRRLPSPRTVLLLDAAGRMVAEPTPQALPVLGRAFEATQIVPGEESPFIQVRQDILTAGDFLHRGSLYEEIALAYRKIRAYD